jgi:hypothetical protein
MALRVQKKCITHIKPSTNPHPCVPVGTVIFTVCVPFFKPVILHRTAWLTVAADSPRLGTV